MAIDITTAESSLQAALDATTSATPAKDLLLLTKAVESMLPSTDLSATYATLAGATFTGNLAGTNLALSGNLTVNGTTTTVNSETLDVADKNITVAKGASDAASADGAGITIEGANATFLYQASTDTFDFNKAISGTYTNLQPEQTVADANSSHSINMNEPLHILNMIGTTNFTFSNIAAGKITMIKLSVGSGTVTFDSATKWPADEEPTWGDHNTWLISVIGNDGSNTLASATGYTV